MQHITVYSNWATENRLRIATAKFPARCHFVLSAFLGLAAAVASGQAAVPASGPAPQTPSAAATSNIEAVSLDLVVHDKGRQTVMGLKPEDLQVADNGTPVTLKDLHLVTGAANADHLVTIVSERFGGSFGRNEQAITGRILKDLPSKGFSFAVMDLVPRLRLIQGFTDDRNAVKDAMRVITEGPREDKAPVIELTASNTVFQKPIAEKDDPSSVVAKNAEKELLSIVRTGADLKGTRLDAQMRARYRTLLDALDSSRKVQQDRHTLPRLAGLLALVQSQQKIAARKCIVYFTQNMQMDSAAKEMVKSIAEAANQAGVTLYVVDMDALDVGGQHQIDNALGAENVAFNPAPVPVEGSGGHATQNPSQQMGPAGPSSNAGMAVDWLRQSDRNPFGDVHSPLADMARETGGTYIDAQENVKKPLQQLVEDMTTYYVASYLPPIQDYDGSFRTIDIRPVRKGLIVKGKTGYFAVAPGAESGIRPFEEPLIKLLADPKPPADIKFRAAVLHFGELSEGDTSSVAIEIPIQQLQTKTDQHTDLFSAHVSVEAQIKDKSGAVIEHFGEDVSHRAAIETIDRDKAATINVARHFPATPGQYTLEVAVLDQLSDKAGVQRVNFEIPSSADGPSLSDVVLVRNIGGVGDDPEEPLLFDKGKITPNVSGDVPEGAKSVSLFFIAHPDAKSKEPVKVEMEVSRNGAPGRRTPLPLKFDESAQAVPYLASFKSGLPPGDYNLKAFISQGNKVSTTQLAFTVQGEQSAPSASGNAIAGLHAESAGDMSATSEPDGPKGQLAITPVTNVLQQPAPEAMKALIDDARERALHYVESLPNFMCIQITSRSFDPTGTGRWKLRDNITELLRYRDKAESRTTLEVNGKTESVDREAMKGTFSSGELGGVLKAVFSEKAKADFTWKETDALGTGTVQVFDYSVAKTNSEFSVVGKNNLEMIVGFHGQVFIDSTAHNVRRITLIADDMPKDFPTHYTSIAVDYDYVLINTHDYLMPITAQLHLQQGRHEAVLNNIEFREYRRFGSSMRILDTNPGPQKQ
jgi:VWFA-related protein